MGIPGLWEILGDGETTSLARLATDHFTKTGRPPRIAVDEAGWRFHNLTPFQVAKIREQEPAANPIEKAIFFRIVKLLKLNVQLLFVSDGPGRPWKRNRKGGGRLDFEQTRLLFQLLDLLKVPRHRAPAEAEAECARLQKEGVVDAVWSDDGDTLMFGCGLLFRELRVENKKSETHIRVYRAETIRQQLGLDREALVAFAVLSGGDYDTKGLPGCGPQLAKQAARHGLGRSLCMMQHERELRVWRQELEAFLAMNNKRIKVPPDFPRWLPVKHYSNPKVSTPEQLRDLRGLKRGWDIDIDQAKLRAFVRLRFNIWTKGYINHIVPVLLAKKLLRTLPQEKERNTRFGISMVLSKKRKKKVAEDNLENNDGDTLLERRITYLPLEVVDIDLSIQPTGALGEDWSILKNKDGTPFDPAIRVETEMSESILRVGLPYVVFDQPTTNPVDAKSKASRKRKSEQDETIDSAEKPKKQRRSRKKVSADVFALDQLTSVDDNEMAEESSLQPPSDETAFLAWWEEQSL